MGYNTSMIIMNDCLDYIARDEQFGRKVSEAVSKLSLPPEYRDERGIDIWSGPAVNAATVIETHHADITSIVAFGQNMGVHLTSAYAYGWSQRNETVEVSILKALADKLGYQVRRKPTPQNDL